ncbi:MAG: Fic family protein [Methanoregulaceae archaeon]|nr:Fic family protein [Methanoregulaceae archaeon]
MLELVRDEAPLTERTVRKVHSLVMKGQESGSAEAYRGPNVMAAGTEFRYPDHLHWAELMAGFVAWWETPSSIHPVLWAAEAHVRFVTIHPFQDGNGRVGRLLLNLALLRHGYPIAVIPVERRAEYIASLERVQKLGDRQHFDAIVLDAVEASLRETLELCASAVGAVASAELRAWLGV